MTGAPAKFHFLGICGTAMGSVAAALRERGFRVTGSDHNIYPPMSTFLERKGIALHQGYRPENIPADAEIIVIGNAITRGNPEVEAVLNRKLYYVSLPEVLKQFFGTDEISFQDCSATLPMPGDDTTCDGSSPVFRSYSTFTQAADENAFSHILIGFHFRKAVEEGTAYGRKIGNRAVDRYLCPVH